MIVKPSFDLGAQATPFDPLIGLRHRLMLSDAAHETPLVRVEVEVETIVFVLIVGGLLWAVFRSGQQFEREEAPRRRRQAEEDAAVDGGLNLIAAVYVMKGRDHPDVEATVRSIASVFPAVRTAWLEMDEGERQRRGAEGLASLGDPDVRARFHRRLAAAGQMAREMQDETRQHILDRREREGTP